MTSDVVWKPSDDIIKSSNIYKMMQKNGFSKYHDFWKWSVKNKEKFWEQTVENLEISLAKKYTSILNSDDGVENAKWLFGSKLNIVDSCFQNDEKAVVISYQDKNSEIKKISQLQLEILVNKIANGIFEQGLKSGDFIAIDMPMTYESVAIYLAAIKAGIPVVTIADSFTPTEISVRLNIAKPKLIFTQDVIKRGEKTLPLYEKIKQATANKCVVIDTQQTSKELSSNDIFWEEFLSDNQNFSSVIQTPEDIITILFSSGTTGEPKAIPWTHTTPIKCASDGYYHHNIQKNDVVCWPTNLGWMMGPWLVFASLINKASIALYYGAPTDSEFGHFVEKAKVTMLGVIPSFVKYWFTSKAMEKYNWNRIKCFSSTGEVSSPKEMAYLMKFANNKPIIEYCGGTEIGGGYITSTVVQNNYPSTFSTQALGGEFVILDENNQKSAAGEIFIVPPILGLSTSLYNKNHHDVYFKNTPTIDGKTLRRHGDRIVQLENNYYKAQGRVDDAMNLGGIKVSSVQIESVIVTLPFIKECAAVAVSPKDGGPSKLVIFYVEKNGHNFKEDRLMTTKKMVSTQLNPLFKVSDLIKIETLPRTASNKIMRRTLRDQYEQNL